MAELFTWAERFMSVPAERVYQCIADFQTNHPNFLPPTFSNFRVEQGGVGAGTVICFEVKVGGRRRTYRMQVDEPEPGRVITESDTGSSLVTTFRLVPEWEGCRVRIETCRQGAGGVVGFFERVFAPRVLRRIYADELERLEHYAKSGV